METKLTAKMGLDEIIDTMAEDDYDAKEVLGKMMKSPLLYKSVILCDKLGIRGQRLVKLYNECCDSNDEKMAKTLLMFKNKVFSLDDILKNIDSLMPEVFLDESIVSYNVPLYSDEFDVGHPDWAEFEYLQKRNFMLKIKRKEAFEKIPEWISEGQKLMYPEKYAKWEANVIENVTDSTTSMAVKNALEIMTLLENGVSIEQTKSVMRAQNNSDNTLETVKELVLKFSNRGPDFYVSTFDELSINQRFEVDKVRKENFKLAESHSMIGQNNIY